MSFSRIADLRPTFRGISVQAQLQQILCFTTLTLDGSKFTAVEALIKDQSGGVILQAFQGFFSFLFLFLFFFFSSFFSSFFSQFSSPDQHDQLAVGSWLQIHDAHIILFKGEMRLKITRASSIRKIDPPPTTLLEGDENNISKTELLYLWDQPATKN